MTDMERLRAWSDENLLASFELLVRHPPTLRTDRFAAVRDRHGVRSRPPIGLLQMPWQSLPQRPLATSRRPSTGSATSGSQ